MRALLDAAGARLPARIVDKIVLSAHGQSGCRRGAQLSLDNLDMAPATLADMHSRRGEPHTYLKASAKKTPAGISGYSFFVDKSPLIDAPPERLARADTTPIRPRSGIWYRSRAEPWIRRETLGLQTENDFVDSITAKTTARNSSPTTTEIR